MMDNDEHLRREYHVNSESYCRVMGIVAAVTFGLYGKGGGTVGQLCVFWVKLGHEVTPQLQAYGDSWQVLATFADLLSRMGEVTAQTFSAEDFCQLLQDCGFTHRPAQGEVDEIFPPQIRMT
jgi:hypothetical protein